MYVHSPSVVEQQLNEHAHHDEDNYGQTWYMLLDFRGLGSRPETFLRGCFDSDAAIQKVASNCDKSLIL